MNVILRTLCVALAAVSGLVFAQPSFENPSPTSDSSTSQKANASADKGMYK